MFDRQKFILVSTKYISYLINLVIVLAVLGGITMWVLFLFQAAN